MIQCNLSLGESCGWVAGVIGASVITRRGNPIILRYRLEVNLGVNPLHQPADEAGSWNRLRLQLVDGIRKWRGAKGDRIQCGNGERAAYCCC